MHSNGDSNVGLGRDQKEIIKNYYSLLIIFVSCLPVSTATATGYVHYGNVYFVDIMFIQMSEFILKVAVNGTCIQV